MASEFNKPPPGWQPHQVVEQQTNHHFKNYLLSIIREIFPVDENRDGSQMLVYSLFKHLAWLLAIVIFFKGCLL